jgi:hypothetical protein
MHDNLPIYEQYRLAGLAWVDAEAAASMLEDLKSNVLSEMMGQLLSEGMAVNRAEQTVKSSSDWKLYVLSIIEARKVANRCKIQVEFLRMRHQEWLSSEANNRTEARL